MKNNAHYFDIGCLKCDHMSWIYFTDINQTHRWPSTANKHVQVLFWCEPAGWHSHDNTDTHVCLCLLLLCVCYHSITPPLYKGCEWACIHIVAFFHYFGSISIKSEVLFYLFSTHCFHPLQQNCIQYFTEIVTTFFFSLRHLHSFVSEPGALLVKIWQPLYRTTRRKQTCALVCMCANMSSVCECMCACDGAAQPSGRSGCKTLH